MAKIGICNQLNQNFYIKPSVEVIETEFQSYIMAGSLGTSEKPASGGTSVLSLDGEDDGEEEKTTVYFQHNEW